MTTLMTAAEAYAKAAKIADLPSPAEAPAPPERSFASLVRDAMGDVERTGTAAEVKSAAHLAGKGELIDVVTALTAAETTLETVIAVRDRVINAYQEISRMPI